MNWSVTAVWMLDAGEGEASADPGSARFMMIKRMLDSIAQDNAVAYTALTLKVSPEVASRMAASNEIKTYSKGIKKPSGMPDYDPEMAFPGLPANLYGWKVVVERPAWHGEEVAVPNGDKK